MIFSLLRDIVTAARLTKKSPNARKAGAAGIQTRPVWNVKDRRPTYWAFTLEGCLLASHMDIVSSETKQSAISAFYTLPEETQHALTFTPKASGEWIQRAAFWRELLHPVLPPKEFHRVMGIIVRHYVRCLRQRKNATYQQASRV